MSGYLALFDMDRTLLDINSAALYVRWRRRHGLSTRADVLRVGYWLLKYKFGLFDAPRVAEQVMRQFKGGREDDLQLDCHRWYHAEVRSHILSQGRLTIEQHRAAGAVLALATSASRYVSKGIPKTLPLPNHAVTLD
jgi:phosphoserine phosphatase